MAKPKPYYVVHKWLGIPGHRWIVRHYDANLRDHGSPFVLNRCRTQKAAKRWMVQMLKDGVDGLAPFADDPYWKELGDRYRRMKAQLDSIVEGD